MKRILILIAVAASALLALSCGRNAKKQAADSATPAETASVVYFTTEITPESLVKIYEAVGRPATGRVAIKISTGEMGGNNYLKPELIAPLVKKVNGTIVECNTAYGGSRATTAVHKETIRAHGFYDVADVDIMDEEGEFQIPVKDDKWISRLLLFQRTTKRSRPEMSGRRRAPGKRAATSGPKRWLISR